MPEAARLLRPGGRLHLLTNHTLVYLTAAEGDDTEAPNEERLVRSQFGMGRTRWPGESSVEFHLPPGEWIRLFRATGFDVLELLEPQIPEGAGTRYTWMPYDWARRWPCEMIWKLERRG